MSKIIGHKSSFGIEYELENEDADAALYGRACFWIEGKRVGNYDLVTPLSDIAHSTIWIINDGGNREDLALCGLTPQEFYNLIYNEIYGDNETFDKSLIPETPARFDVTIRTPSFAGWLFFLLDCDLQSRLVYRNVASPGHIFYVQLPYGEFDKVIKTFHDCIEEEYNLNIRKQS